MIVGAGLAGLIAAHLLPGHEILERNPAPLESHGALLRFRSKAVADVTGIEFRPVEVRKGIYFSGQFHEPNILLSLQYSRKVLDGALRPRSIWDVKPVTRYIAPPDFYSRLVEAQKARIIWGTEVDFVDVTSRPIVSTAPLFVTLRETGLATPEGLQFKRAEISVRRYRLPDSDVHLTVYFPAQAHTLYRASITGDLLICEFVSDPAGSWAQDVSAAFGFTQAAWEELEPLPAVRQEYGKILPIASDARRSLIARLTNERNVFSLGRFATWRNILLDDVVKDVGVIKKLLNASEYERRIIANRNREN